MWAAGKVRQGYTFYHERNEPQRSLPHIYIYAFIHWKSLKVCTHALYHTVCISILIYIHYMQFDHTTFKSHVLFRFIFPLKQTWKRDLMRVFLSSFPLFPLQPRGHRYVLSPPGKGYDCTRTWEALAMGRSEYRATHGHQKLGHVLTGPVPHLDLCWHVYDLRALGVLYCPSESPTHPSKYRTRQWHQRCRRHHLLRRYDWIPNIYRS